MPKDFAFADLYPKDPRAPFANPTEEPGFTPDYRAIVPELDLPQSRLPLLPNYEESTRIRRYCSLTCLTLLVAFLLTLTVQTGLTLIISALLQISDSAAVGTLPENYQSIVSQYFTDSSLAYAVTLIAFLFGNVAAFLLGCRLTKIAPRDCFRTRDLRVSATISYILLGLFIQLMCGHISAWLELLIPSLHMQNSQADMTATGSMHRLAVFALYTCIVAPVTEELLMRGFVLKNLSRVSQRHGIFLSALLFGLLHENVPQFLFAFPLGIFLAYITIRHNSVVPAIAVHIAVNTTQMVLLILEQHLPQQSASKVYMIFTLAVLLLGAIVFVATLMTERLPAVTPHQSMRGWRIYISSPLLWMLVAVHIGFGMYQAGMLELPFLSS